MNYIAAGYQDLHAAAPYAPDAAEKSTGTSFWCSYFGRAVACHIVADFAHIMTPQCQEVQSRTSRSWYVAPTYHRSPMRKSQLSLLRNIES